MCVCIKQQTFIMDKSSKHVTTPCRKIDEGNQPLPPPPPNPLVRNVFDEAFQSESERTEKTIPARKGIVTTAMEKENEFLDYLMTLQTPMSKVKESINESTKQYNPKAQITEKYKKTEEIRNTPKMNRKLEENLKLEKEIEGITHPLLLRTACTFAATLATEDAFDHLDKLYKLMDQLLSLKEQNCKLQKRVRDVEQFRNLRNMHRKIEATACSAKSAGIEMFKDESEEIEYETGLTESLLDTILAAGRNASHKRSNKWKGPSPFRQSLIRRQRSKSIGIEDTTPIGSSGHQEYHGLIHYPARRKSSNEPKSKVSKWTKVKAAFKWEKASNSVSLGIHETKSQDSGLGGMLPVNNEVARYLRVPSVSADPNSNAGNSASLADSVISGSSGALGGQIGLQSDLSVPATPGTLSSASSAEELDMADSYKCTSEYCPQRCASAADTRGAQLRPPGRQLSENRNGPEDEARRSHSLDGDACISSSVFLAKHFNKDQDCCKATSKTHRTTWGKVKNIIQTHRHSLKGKPQRHSIKMNSSKNEESDDMWSITSDHDMPFVEASEESHPRIEIITETNSLTPREECDSTTTSRDNLKRLTPILTVTMPSTEELRSTNRDKVEVVCKDTYRGEGLRRSQQPSSPQATRQESVEGDLSPPLHREDSKWAKVKRAFLSGSVPSSPNVHSAFFGEFESDDLSSGDFSEPSSPSRVAMPLNFKIREDIQKNYAELQHKLSQEDHDKLLEWERKKAGSAASVCSVMMGVASRGVGIGTIHVEDMEFNKKMEAWNKLKQLSLRYPQSSPTSEETLSADFKKKWYEWQRIKKLQSASTSREETCTTPKPSSSTGAICKKKITDWQRWKTGHVKYEGQGISQLPDQRDLSDDFIKKMDEWKRLKATNSVPSYSGNQDIVAPVRSSKSSPDYSKTTSSNSKKYKAKELQWLDKELQKIEREKQRLERERAKYLDREERISRLSSGAGSGTLKKEVLVQTSTGFFRFQGISRKFTRRLYEWEKARGIGPEASTFALLHPGYKPLQMERAPPIESGSIIKQNHEKRIASKLVRSMSVGSVANASGASISHQPSSLSLNDVDELEAACLVDSVCMNAHLDEDQGPNDEPEAVIVDVEDEIEETAAPLETVNIIEHQTPVYKYAKPEVAVLCDGEECAAPRVQHSSFSSSHLLNIELQRKQTPTKIEPNTEYTLGDHDTERDSVEMLSPIQSDNIEEILSELRNSMAQCTPSVDEDLYVLAAELIKRTESTETAKSDHRSNYPQTQPLQDILDVLDPLKRSISLRTDEFDPEPVNTRSSVATCEKPFDTEDQSDDCLFTNVTITPGFLKKWKRSISITPPEKNNERSVSQSSVDSISESSLLTSCKITDKLEQHHSKEEIEKKTSNKRKLKNRVKLGREKLKQLSMDSNSDEELDTNSVEPEGQRKTLLKKKLVRTKKISDCETGLTNEGDDDVVYVLKIKQGQIIEQSKVISCKQSCSDKEMIVKQKSLHEHYPSNEGIVSPNISIGSIDSLNSQSVFVKTVRKIFSPLPDSNGNTSAVIGVDVGDLPMEEIVIDCEKRSKNNSENQPAVEKKHISRLPSKEILEGSYPANNNKMEENVASRKSQLTQTSPNFPPLPQSPTSARRDLYKPGLKETAPSIRMMIAKYNQRLTEEGPGRNSPVGSSGSGSPVAWRSPVAERRVRTQTEKYQKEVQRVLQHGTHKLVVQTPLVEVQKSASVGTIRAECAGGSQDSVKQNIDADASNKMLRGILKSSSAGAIEVQLEQNLKNKESDKNNTERKLIDQQTSHLMEPCILKNTPPRIQRKFESKPPSPRFPCKLIRSPLSSLSAPSTPIDSSDLPPSPAAMQRARKLQKAKEEFLCSGTCSLTLPSTSTCSKDLSKADIIRNRLSQVSVGSESSYEGAIEGQLVKSASAGMINVDPTTYEQFSYHRHAMGYVSLPRTSTAPDSGSKYSLTSGKFGLSNITSKFRKVKLRKNKEKSQKKMNTVSMLCRQSLVVDINVQPAVEDSASEKSLKSTAK